MSSGRVSTWRELFGLMRSARRQMVDDHGHVVGNIGFVVVTSLVMVTIWNHRHPLKESSSAEMDWIDEMWLKGRR